MKNLKLLRLLACLNKISRPAHPNAESLAAIAEAQRISRDPAVKGRNLDALFEDLDSDE